MRHRFNAPPKPAGFTLIEIMVALVIGVLSTLVIMKMFAVSEGYKRTTSSGADAQTNSAVALYLIERDVRQAGFGMAPNLEDFASTPLLSNPPNGPLTGGVLALCPTVNAYHSGRTITYGNSLFAPVLINPQDATGSLVFPAGDVNTDLILVNYGASGDLAGKGIDITTNSSTTQSGGDALDYAATASRAGINQGDLILVVPPTGSGLACSIREVTGLPVSAAPGQCTTAIIGGINQINNNSNVNYENYYTGCTTVTPSWNQPGGSGVTYNAGSKVYSLGPVGRFVSRVYAVRGGNLTMCDFTAKDCTDSTKTGDATYWTPIASGIVGFGAQYGKDDGSSGGTANDGIVDGWDNTQPTGTARAQVISFRMAVVARNQQYEKTDSSGNDVTMANPVWQPDVPGTANITVDISQSLGTANPNLWKHYRYRLAQTVVPLRNMIWGQQK